MSQGQGRQRGRGDGEPRRRALVQGGVGQEKDVRAALVIRTYLRDQRGWGTPSPFGREGSDVAVGFRAPASFFSRPACLPRSVGAAQITFDLHVCSRIAHGGGGKRTDSSANAKVVWALLVSPDQAKRGICYMRCLTARDRNFVFPTLTFLVRVALRWVLAPKLLGVTPGAARACLISGRLRPSVDPGRDPLLRTGLAGRGKGARLPVQGFANIRSMRGSSHGTTG